MESNNKNNLNFDRREALKMLSMMTGYAITASAASAFLSGCKAEPIKNNVDAKSSSTITPGLIVEKSYTSVLSKEQLATIAEISERIIPKTDTPGAKDANVAEYISRAVSVVYNKNNQKRFIDNIGKFDASSQLKFKKPFVAISDGEKDQILNLLAQEWMNLRDEIAAKKKVEKDSKKRNELSDYHIFKEMRDLTVTGYCTSEAGATKLLKYDPIPGPYQADIPRKGLKTYSLS